MTTTYFPFEAGETRPRANSAAVSTLDGKGLVLFINSIMMGGAEEHVRQVASGFRTRGADVTVIMPKSSKVDELAVSLEATGIRVARLTLTMREDGALRHFRELVRLLSDLRPFVYHVHTIGFTGGRLAIWAGRLARVPIVCTMHMAPGVRQPLKVRLERALNSVLINRFVAVSKDNASHLREHLGLPEKRLVVVPNAVELAQFEGDSAPDRLRIRQEFDIPADAILAGALARLDPQKGLSYLLKALPATFARHPKLRVLIVGDGPLREELEAEARALGIANRVHFAGYRRDSVAMLRAMDFALLPSIFEGLPLSLLESMAAGLPVVATSVGGIPEAVVDGVTGFLVPPADVAAFTQAMNQLLDDPLLCQRMGAAARARSLEFSLDALLDRLTTVYQDSRAPQ